MCKPIHYSICNMIIDLYKLSTFISRHDFKLVFDVDIQKTLTKADRLIYGESAMTHAMVFTAVSLDVSIQTDL